MKKCNGECYSIGMMACPNGVMTGGVCYVRLMKACAIIGEHEVIEIAQRLVHARNKHPDNGGSLIESLKALEDECREVREAYEAGDIEHASDECLDVISCSRRFRGKEYATHD